jgi:phosphate starvation-inducible protein PhoH and related proteins
MKMFLTRLGFNSKMVITGDITQIDLPDGRRSGLLSAMEVVQQVDGISFTYFDERDVVRHHLVQKIVRAYESHAQAAAQASTDQGGFKFTSDSERPQL